MQSASPAHFAMRRTCAFRFMPKFQAAPRSLAAAPHSSQPPLKQSISNELQVQMRFAEASGTRCLKPPHQLLHFGARQRFPKEPQVTEHVWYLQAIENRIPVRVDEPQHAEAVIIRVWKNPARRVDPRTSLFA